MRLTILAVLALVLIGCRQAAEGQVVTVYSPVVEYSTPAGTRSKPEPTQQE